MDLINTFSYKNFDANITLQFVGGVDKAIVHESAEDRQFVSGMVNRVLDAWRPDHQEGAMVAQVKLAMQGHNMTHYSDTHEIYNAAFIRGASASLGYTFYDIIGIEQIAGLLRHCGKFLPYGRPLRWKGMILKVVHRTKSDD